MENIVAVVLAAGKGTRMKSKLPKVIHPIAGKPMAAHVLETVNGIGIERALLVIGYGAGQVKEALGDEWEYVLQEEQKGTGHAVLQTKEALFNDKGDVLILYGDTPLLTQTIVEKLMKAHRKEQNDATVLTARLSDPGGYGRIVRNQQGEVVRIVEHKDATKDERGIDEVNTGIYCLRIEILWEALDEVETDNQQNEMYLTDIFHILRDRKKKIGTVTTEDIDEITGINSRQELAKAEKIMQDRLRNYWMSEGVTMIDPSTVFIDKDVSLEADVVLKPFTTLQGNTAIGEDAEIGPQVQIKNTKIGSGAKVEQSVIMDSVLGDGSTVGPFAYIRPETVVSESAKVGTFVEVKKSTIGPKSKVPHLSYVGDGVIGKGVNIGAGVIFVNYDGQKKFVTNVEDGAFVGCNANLIAPVTVKKGSYIAAGSTINKEVPEGALGIARSRQENKLDWVKKRKGKQEKE